MNNGFIRLRIHAIKYKILKDVCKKEDSLNKIATLKYINLWIENL